MPQVLKIGSKNLNGENWKVLNPDGHHMFTCGERKAMWYLDKDLAAHTDEKNTIMLTFVPKGYGFDENEVFGLAGREIKCVVTGEMEGLQRHHIVPYCYRTHFPEEYKSKNHHDVVLVTYKIHEDYERKAFDYKNHMSELYGVPTLNELNLEYTKLLSSHSSDKVKMLSKFHAIFKNYHSIPNKVVLDNLKAVSEHTEIPYNKVTSFNYIQLYKLYLLLRERHEEEFNTFKETNRLRFDHGFHIVSKLDTHEKKEEFVKMWRTHFIETMNPPYMPLGWSVEFRVKVKL